MPGPVFVAALMLYAMLPALVQAEIWHSTATGGIKTLLSRQTAKYGSLGKMAVFGLAATKVRNLPRLRRMILAEFLSGRIGIVWAIEPDGMLWKFAAGNWTKITAGGMRDVAVATERLDMACRQERNHMELAG